MKAPGSYSLVAQFVAASVAISGVIILILAWFVSQQTYTMMLDRADKDLKSQVHSTRKLMDTAYDISVGLTDKVAAILVSSFPAGFAVNEAETSQVGSASAPILRYQGQSLNNDFRMVDEFSRTTGGVATLFVRQGEDFVRVTTSLKNEKGERAIGTRLAHDHPAYAKMLAGETYLGVARLFGKNYMTKYVPAKDGNGKVIAIMFVGFDLEPVLASLKTTVGEQKFGESGYAYVAYTTGQDKGRLMIHPTQEGKNLLSEVNDAEGKNPFAPMFQQDKGFLQYPWKDTSGTPMTRLVAYEQTSTWGGILVAGGGYVEEYTRDSRMLRNIILTASAGAAVLLGVMLWLFMVSRLRPVAGVVAMLERMGAGDMTVRVTRPIAADTRNELDIIARCVDTTARSVGSLVGELRHNAIEVEQTASGLAGISRELADTASTQHDAAAAMAAGVEEMAVSVNLVSDSAQHSSTFTKHTLSLSGQGRDATSEVLDQMTQIEASVETASGHIEKLDDDAQRISTVVSIIKEIADQTNLLALNAAIEAARAGESGRGFAVVADEVRKLAERTAKSTGEISEMVGSIQTGAHEAVIGMHQAVDLVKTGVGTVGAARQVIGDIEKGAGDVAASTADIADALKEQAAASNAIGHEVERISRLSEKTANSAQESSSAVVRLEGLAGAMSAAVGRFRVE